MSYNFLESGELPDSYPHLVAPMELEGLDQAQQMLALWLDGWEEKGKPCYWFPVEYSGRVTAWLGVPYGLVMLTEGDNHSLVSVGLHTAPAHDLNLVVYNKDVFMLPHYIYQMGGITE